MNIDWNLKKLGKLFLRCNIMTAKLTEINFQNAFSTWPQIRPQEQSHNALWQPYRSSAQPQSGEFCVCVKELSNDFSTVMTKTEISSWHGPFKLKMSFLTHVSHLAPVQFQSLCLQYTHPDYQDHCREHRFSPSPQVEFQRSTSELCAIHFATPEWQRLRGHWH